ncbi:MAG: acyl carrier protein [Gammaproteobacteria bacterium]|nr:acyl carrier protein [Gammaproteobacteria bacterium]
MNDRKQILDKVIEILKEMTYDWDMDYEGELNPEVRLIEDLGFASIDIVQFVVAIEAGFQRRDLPFEKLLLKDGRYIDELHIKNVVDFLEENIQ